MLMNYTQFIKYFIWKSSWKNVKKKLNKFKVIFKKELQLK